MSSSLAASRGPAWLRLWRSSPFPAVVASRSLLWAFAERDFRTRYRTSAIGWTWSLIQPLATLAVFAVVFSVAFRAPAPDLGNGEGSSYVLYLFTALVAWNLFSSTSA
jgi:ABC-2 type transport system permease protein